MVRRFLYLDGWRLAERTGEMKHWMRNKFEVVGIDTLASKPQRK